MNYAQIKIIMALVLSSPFIILISLSLIFSPSSFEVSRFFEGITVVFLRLLIFYVSFYAILSIMPEKITPHFVALVIYGYLIFLGIFLFNATYTAPDFRGLVINLSTLPAISLAKFLWGASFLTAGIMFFMRADKKTLLSILLGAIMISSSMVASKELLYRYRMDQFWGNRGTGEIIFASSFKIEIEPRKFCLSDKKIKGISAVEYTRAKTHLLSMKHKGNTSKFELNEYAYDRDDLTKIFVTDRETGKTILLAAGYNPLWADKTR